jgi:hypothetical protein
MPNEAVIDRNENIVVKTFVHVLNSQNAFGGHNKFFIPEFLVDYLSIVIFNFFNFVIGLKASPSMIVTSKPIGKVYEDRLKVLCDSAFKFKNWR